ncbi:MAG TPA: hypothetical protein VNF73_01945 [Candidatus Saccharimonadales bacterium]|nr:hypothetical protein [Candidatus Saccharimonadales bacterium]
MDAEGIWFVVVTRWRDLGAIRAWLGGDEGRPGCVSGEADLVARATIRHDTAIEA